MPTSPSATTGAVAAALVLALAVLEPLRAAGPLYDHRVVVATTSLDRELDVDASLDRQVNRLGALGYELTALAGGDSALLDRMLHRKAHVPGLVDHAGFTFAVMARPVDQPVVARAYRIVHIRTGFGLDRVVEPLGVDGYRLTATAIEGDIVHLAFERTPGTPAVEYRVFRNRGRKSWMDVALADPDARMRITRVMPVALDAAVVELGAPQATPADMKWLTRDANTFTALEGPLRDLAKAGYRVELVRARANNVSALVLKPAGVTTSTADWDLDDGPWGSPCSRGAIAGAAVMPGGDVACAADRSAASVSNRGLDLTLREQPSASGHILFRGPDCDIRARLRSLRSAAPRVALAAQFEREIRAQIQPGFRVTRALATSDSNGQMRIVALTSDAPAAMPSGAPVNCGGAGAARARRGRSRRRPHAPARGQTERGHRHRPPVARHIRVARIRRADPARTARLLGCVPTTIGRELATSAARGLLINHGLADYRLDSRVIVDR